MPKRKILYPALQAPPQATFAETTTLDRWHQPLAVPTRRIAGRNFAGSFLVEAAPFKESVSIDRWLEPLSEPKRNRQPTNVAIAGPVLTEAIFTETVTLDRWLQPLAEPVRRVKFRGQQDGILPPPQIAATAEIVTVDKWLQPLAEPTIRSLRNPAGPVLTKATPFAEAVSLDRWQQPFSEPVRRVKNQTAGPVYVRGIERTTVDRWHEPFSEPVRRIVRVREGYSVAPVFVPITAVTHTVTSALGGTIVKRTALTAGMDFRFQGLVMAQLSGILYSSERAPDSRTVNIT